MFYKKIKKAHDILINRVVLLQGKIGDSLDMYWFLSVLETLQFVLKESNEMTLLPWFPLGT